MRKLLLKMVLLTGIVLVCVSYMSYYVTEKREGVDRWTEFYNQEENTVDILFTGSSLSIFSFIPQVFNAKLNAKTYNLAIPVLNIKQIYYNLPEIVKHQKLKVLVVEARSIDIVDAGEDNRLGYKFENLDGQNLNLNKVKSVLGQFSEKSNIVNSFFPYFRNHHEWANLELLEENLNYEYKPSEYDGYKIGIYRRVKDNTIKKRLKEVPKDFKFPEENIEYLGKVVDFCNENDIKLHIVRAPVLNYSTYKGFYLDEVSPITKKLCDSLQISYTDLYPTGDVEKLNITKVDYYDMVHFNHLGALKFSEKIADVFANQYNFEPKEDDAFMQNDAEYYLYNNKLDEAKTVFKGDFQLSEDILIKEVRIQRTKNNEHIFFILLDKETDITEMTSHRLGIYYYPVKEQMPLLKLPKEAKVSWKRIVTDHAIPTNYKDYKVVHAAYETIDPTNFRKIEIKFFKVREGWIKKILTIEDVDLTE
ncbi:hypothetical protein KORDIASMS9_01185 [Kordia sp. SMS9]|uniref:hypothetical protein n=1 Tax=Kordia sp. SMS9 TaxID=2282170 RepID=UPI000E101AF5|nr:hypothetical protein [Kordia sp. SMS9]AXG68966.1 hypothetical protein KORDIASMS9_01185 [Kordia sp. SMS9]